MTFQMNKLLLRQIPIVSEESFTRFSEIFADPLNKLELNFTFRSCNIKIPT